jgi:cell wall-associated NlpC family hydrolase
MIITESVSDLIVTVAFRYLDCPFDYEKFNCVHYVREVYSLAGIKLPLLDRAGFPPNDFHLSEEEFALMPRGHSVFFRRKASIAHRVWTHVAIIVSKDELIHCSRSFGKKVATTSKAEFMEIYNLAPQPL